MDPRWIRGSTCPSAAHSSVRGLLHTALTGMTGPLGAALGSVWTLVCSIVAAKKDCQLGLPLRLYHTRSVWEGEGGE